MSVIQISALIYAAVVTLIPERSCAGVGFRQVEQNLALMTTDVDVGNGAIG